MGFIHKTADGQTLSAQDKRGALAISPTLSSRGPPPSLVVDDMWILLKTADGQFLNAQNKRGALAISPA